MPFLEVRGLKKYFGGLPAVNNLDLSVAKGEIVGLIGPNGAGKTTAFNVISGYFPPTSGKVIFKGEDITGLGMHQVAQRGLVRTFQHSTLFSEMTVLENMTLGFHLKSRINFLGDIFKSTAAQTTWKELEKRSLDLLEVLGLFELRNKTAGSLPYGYQRLLGVGIALAVEPELILLDEPVTGMNPEESRLMTNHIRKIRERGVTVLLVEHTMKVVMSVCQKICVLSSGEKMAEGSPEEIKNNQRVIRAYLGAKYAARG